MKRFSIVLVGLLFALSASARDHREFNGVWTLEQAKSDFAGQPVVQTGTVTIDDRQGNVTVSRNFKYEGATETVFYRDMTDSRRGATIHSGKDFKSKSSWDHDALKVVTTEDGGSTVETYRLTGDGEMTAIVARPGQKPITMIFHRP